MVKSNATNVEQYLAEISESRRFALLAIRETILENLPDGYVEVMNWGMITYEVPLDQSGKTYNGKPLMYVALASQKNHMSIHLCGIYCDNEQKKQLQSAYEKVGMKLEMGAACIRFRSLEKLCLPAIADAVAATPMKTFIASSKRSK